jgi:hypothetical protein
MMQRQIGGMKVGAVGLSGDELATLSGVTNSAMTAPVPVTGDEVTGLELA